MSAFYSKKSRDWRLDVQLTTENVDKLEPIPGLGFFREGNQVRGMVDAIAAACMVMGIPPPDSRQYQPGGGLAVQTEMPLKGYQVEGVCSLAKIISHVGGALLADDMGLGKTLQTIALANFMRLTRILVVCPRFMSFGWQDELEKWGERDYALITSGSTKRHEDTWALSRTAKWVITSYEMMEKVMSGSFAQSVPDFIVFDEAHMIKNVGAGRSQVAKDAATLVPYKLAITATPMWSRPKDFYGILKVLFGHRFGSRTAFFTRYCGGRINEHGGLEAKGATHEEELKLRLSHYMVRREKKDVLRELPSLTRQVVWLPADAEGEKALKAAVLNKRANATYEAVRSTAVAKLDAAVELAVQAKKFVLFTYEKAHAKELASRIDKHQVPCVCITGDISVEKRQALIKQATSTGGGIVATIDSLGAGVNLQGVANVGIMHVLDWVPLKMAQAEARIHRLGQTLPVHWYYLACHETMDEIVVKNIVEKLDQWRAIIGSASNRSLRDDLAGGDTEANEAAALKAIYEAMGE